MATEELKAQISEKSANEGRKLLLLGPSGTLSSSGYLFMPSDYLIFEIWTVAVEVGLTLKIVHHSSISLQLSNHAFPHLSVLGPS